jgi:PPOX class probable F420-dependent enzyme
MDETLMRRRVAEARVGRLATITADGRPHVVPCCFALDGETLYSAVDGKPKSTLALRRLDNVRAYPGASLVVDHYDDDDWTRLWWVRVDGTARVIEPDAPGAFRGLDEAERLELDRALALMSTKYEQYRIVPPPGAVIAIDATAWRAWQWAGS